MTLLQAYLSNPRTRRTLSKKPGQAGFSLIELVVVIAVLAVLVAIALPNFLGVNDDGMARAAQNAVTNAVKECAINAARGSVGTFTTPALARYNVVPGTGGSAPVAASGNACTEAAGTTGVGSYNVGSATKYPTFHATWKGVKTCTRGTGTGAITTGCSGSGTWE